MSQKVKLWLYACLIAAAGALAYSDSFRASFVFDDQDAIVANGSIRHLDTAFFPPAEPTTTVSGRPLLNFTLGLSHALSGPDVWGYHALNLLIHVLAGLTLFGLVRRTLELLGRPSPFAAFAAGLLWTVHPLQTEAVTYIVQRAESQMGLFFLLTFYCFARHAASDRPRQWLALSLLSCLCAAGTKEVTATAPLLVLLYDRTFLAGSFQGAWRRRRGYYLGLAGTWLVLLLLIAGTGWNRGGSIGFGISESPLAYALTQFRAVATYLGDSLWPHPLVFDHGPIAAHGAGDVVPYALVVLPLLAAAVWAVVRRPVAGFLGAWFFVILAPTSSIVPGTTQFIVEHRMYLPLAAVVVLLVVPAVRRWPRAGPVLIASAAFACVAVTWCRNQIYRTNQSLWAATVAQVPADPYAHDNLGAALEDEHDYAGAIAECDLALRLDPRLVEPRVVLANALALEGRRDQAIAVYEDALRLNPSFVKARIDLGNALEQSGRLDEAIAQYLAALRLAPGQADAESNLGFALAKEGRLDEAIERYQAALRSDSDYAPAEFNWGNACLRSGRFAEAEGHFAAALRMQPDFADAALNLGNLLLGDGRPGRALVLLRRAVDERPGSPDARNSLGLALLRTGDLAGAIGQFSQALQLRPGYRAAQANLDAALHLRSGS